MYDAVRDILTRDNSPQESWCQGHSNARDILTPIAPNFCALLFFFSLFHAMPRLRFFFSRRLTFGYCDISMIFSANCKLHRNLCSAETTQKRVVFSRKES